MTCEQLWQLIDDYLTGELFYEQQRLVEWHISSCEHCRLQVCTYRYTVLAVRQLPQQMPLPDHLVARLWQLIQREFEGPRRGSETDQPG